MFKKWLYLVENQQVSGGITSKTGNPGTARYRVDTPTGSRTFMVLFAKNNDEVHINFLGDDSDPANTDKSIHIPAIMQQFANDLCQKFGPFDPNKITYTPATGGTDRGAEVRTRLFQRYIRQLAQNMPPTCQVQKPTQPVQQTSRFASHPLRTAFRGSDDEFASFFGL